MAPRRNPPSRQVASRRSSVRRASSTSFMEISVDTRKVRAVATAHGTVWARGAEVRDERVGRAHRRPFFEREHLHDRGSNRLRLGDRAEINEPHTVVEALQHVSADVQREPRLAAAARPVRVTNRSTPMRRLNSANSAARPMKVVRCTGRLCRRASSDRNGGNSSSRSGWQSWNTRAGRERSLNRCNPRSRRLTPSGRASATSSLSPPTPPSARRVQGCATGPCG